VLLCVLRAFAEKKLKGRKGDNIQNPFEHYISQRLA